MQLINLVFSGVQGNILLYIQPRTNHKMLQLEMNVSCHQIYL